MHKLAKHKRSKTILALSRLYNKSDHNFYMSLECESGSNPIRSKKSVLRSRWRVFLTNITVVFLLLLVTSSLPHSVLASNTGWIDQQTKHLRTRSSFITIPFSPTSHQNNYYCHSIFAPSNLPKTAKRIPKEMLYQVENKILLSPIVFQGRLISRSNTYNSMYFATVRVHGRVFKGKIPMVSQRNIRLLFHTASSKGLTVSTSGSSNRCRPVPFNVRPGRRYIFYAKKVSAGRFVPVAIPDVAIKKTRKLVRKLTCKDCGLPSLTPLPETTSVTEDQTLKLKCKLKSGGGGSSMITSNLVQWEFNGRPIKPDFRLRIKTKKRRSILRLSDIRGSDSGTYTCRVRNVLGVASTQTRVRVRYSAPVAPPSQCPIPGFCLNGGSCMFYQMIGELVCRCSEGFVGQRCQFKKAMLDLPDFGEDGCGPYGHEIHLQEVCAAWKRPPEAEMTKDQFQQWQLVEHQLEDIKREKELEQMEFFRQMGS